MDNVWPGILVGVVVGLVVAVTTQLLTHILQYRRGVKEKRLELYLELMTLASDEIFRARTVEAAVVTGDPLTTDEGRKWWVDKDDQRHAIRRDISRVVSRLHLVEHDKLLRQRLAALPKTQPFLVPMKWGFPQALERVERYGEGIREFNKEVSEIAEIILKRHTWTEPFGAMIREQQRHDDQ
jgi:hypothetical protein